MPCRNENRHIRYIVRLLVEVNKMKMTLKNTKTNAEDIAKKQSPPNEKHGYVKKNHSYRETLGTQRLQCSDHADAFKNNDDEGRNHVNACHKQHQCNDDDTVNVLQVQPSEYLRVYLVNTLCIQLRTYVLIHLFNHVIELVKIIDGYFITAGFSVRPAIKLPDV